MDTSQLVSATVVCKRLGIPRGVLYRAVADGRVTPRQFKRQPWHKRAVMGFDLADVAAALGVPVPGRE